MTWSVVPGSWSRVGSGLAGKWNIVRKSPVLEHIPAAAVPDSSVDWSTAVAGSTPVADLSPADIRSVAGCTGCFLLLHSSAARSRRTSCHSSAHRTRTVGTSSRHVHRCNTAGS